MRLHQVLLVTVVTILIGTDALPPAKTTKLSTSNLSLSDATKRMLRTDRVEEKEERGAMSGFWQNAKVSWWLETGKSDDYVKGKLKLKNLHGDALRNNKNYKYYAYFTKKSEDYLLNGWLRKDINTFQAWQELKLPNVKKLEDFDVAVLNTDKFRVYSRYVKDFDTNVRRKVHAGYLPPANMLGRSEVETTLRTLVMAREQT